MYSGVTMKNTLCLGVFLSLIYFRNLTWEFSSEVLMVLIVCVVMAPPHQLPDDIPALDLPRGIHTVPSVSRLRLCPRAHLPLVIDVCFSTHYA
jgi:hypothetical protein